MTCALGCGCDQRPPGFVLDGPGVFLGQGAGYQIIRQPVGWNVVDPDGETIYMPGTLAATLDRANADATLHARAAGHGHP